MGVSLAANLCCRQAWELSVSKLLDKALVCGWRVEKRSVGGETVATEPERNAAVEPQTEARRFCGILTIPLVTRARFAQRNGRGREGEEADWQPAK